MASLKLVAIRWLSRLATCLALHRSVPGAPLSAETVLDRLQALLKPETLVWRAIQCAIEDIASDWLGLDDSCAELVMQEVQEKLLYILQSQMGWPEMAVVIHLARLSTTEPVPGGAAEAIGEFLVQMHRTDDERVFYRTHQRGGLIRGAAPSSGQAELRLALLERMRRSIRRWRSLSMQGFVVGGRYCAAGCSDDAHQDYFNSSNVLSRWATLVVDESYRAIWKELIVGLPRGGVGVKGLPFLGEDPTVVWGHQRREFDEKLQEVLGMPLAQAGLLPGGRLVVVNEEPRVAAVLSLDPACFRLAPGDRVEYTSLAHYCHSLLDAPISAAIETQVQLTLRPPPAVWVSGAVRLSGGAVMALLEH